MRNPRNDGDRTMVQRAMLDAITEAICHPTDGPLRRAAAKVSPQAHTVLRCSVF